MSTKAPVCPVHKSNPKRAETKKKRGFGSLAMTEAKMDQEQWTQKHDPLFKVKGIGRHRKLKEVR